MRLREAREGEDDVGQGQECERRTRKLAEQTVLRDTARSNALGLHLRILKARDSWLISCGCIHCRSSRIPRHLSVLICKSTGDTPNRHLVEKSDTGCRAIPMPMTEVFISFSYFESAQSK